MQTLCGDDDLRIGLYVKEYVGSMGEQRAYQDRGGPQQASAPSTASPGAEPFAEADNDALFDQKVAKVAQMYPTVINRIYRAVMDAEKSS